MYDSDFTSRPHAPGPTSATVRPAPQTIGIYPLRSEHYSNLFEVTQRLAAGLELEVLFLGRTSRLGEAAIDVSGSDASRLASRLQDYFLDAEVWLMSADSRP